MPKFHSYLTSPVFTLVVGPQRREFFVPSALLAEHSPTFRTLVNGPFKESSDRRAEWDQWDEDTVVRFIEWLYTGAYEFPSPEHQLVSTKPVKETTENLTDETSEDKAIVADTARTRALGSSANVWNVRRPLTPIPAMRTPDYGVEMMGRQFGQLLDLESNSVPKREYVDYEAALMAHAKVYVLAQYTNIPALCQQTHDWTLRTLKSLESTFSNGRSVVVLAEYVYANTNGLSKGEDPLRKIVSTFIAWNYQYMVSHTPLMGLLGQGGDLIRDVGHKLAQRMRALENKEGYLEEAYMAQVLESEEVRMKMTKKCTELEVLRQELKKEKEVRRKTSDQLSISTAEKEILEQEVSKLKRKALKLQTKKM